MKRKSIITVLALVLVLALSLSIFSACNKKHKYSSEWKFDEKTHWHECTTKKHTDTSEKLPHEFKEVIVKAADYGVVGEKKFTCKDCGYSYTEDIDALGAKDNEIVLVAGKTLGKEYDGEVISITKDDFVIEGNRAPTIMFKVKGAEDDAYAATAPKKVGEYTVKVSVRATAEWKSATKTFDFAITPMVISVDWEHPYDNKNVFSGEPAELLEGEEAMITVTMSSANVGAEVQSFEITGKDAGNYSLAREDVNVEIIKADINFEISNASAFNELFFVGATNIPDPTTNYVEIGTGYGERTIEWIMHLGDGVWSPALPKSMVRENPGEWRVCIQYEDGINYNFGKTEYVYFTVKAKARRLTVKNFTGKTYDGKPVANFTFNNLVNKFSATTLDGVVNITSATESGEKYVEYRKKGDTLWTKVTDVAIPKNAAEYEYRIGVTATDEWEAVVSEVNTFTIKPYEFVLDLGYVENQHNSSSDGGKTFKLRTFSAKNGNELIEGQVIELWLNNEKAGFNTSGSHFVPDQKKKVKTDCFFLKISNFVSANMENYKIVTKSPSVTTVEITVVESLTGEKSTTGPIQALNEKERWINATVVKGYFKVGQTVVIYNKAGDILGEAKITEIKVGSTTSASGCAIPSDGLVTITLDKVFSGMTYGKLVAK